MSHLVLANAVGIKVGGREQRDIADIFALTESEYLELAYCDPAAGRRDYKAMPDADVLAASRNREATARYGWSPYLHDPKLRNRLHRIRIPTLILWGMNDRVLSEAYGRAFCGAIPGARFAPIERAGHFPHLEQPQEFAEKVFAFIDQRRIANSWLLLPYSLFAIRHLAEHTDARLPVHRAALSGRLEGPWRLAAGDPAQPRAAIPPSPPTSSTATTTNG